METSTSMWVPTRRVDNRENRVYARAWKERMAGTKTSKILDQPANGARSHNPNQPPT